LRAARETLNGLDMQEARLRAKFGRTLRN
jgi:hypothetical protein